MEAGGPFGGIDTPVCQGVWLAGACGVGSRGPRGREPQRLLLREAGPWV